MTLWSTVGAGLWTERSRWSRARWQAHLGRAEVSFLIAANGEEDIGCFELTAMARGAKLQGFGLVPKYRRQGLGGGLLTEATRRAFAAGAKKVWLHTATDDHPNALPNYLSGGYRVVRERELKHPMPALPELTVLSPGDEPEGLFEQARHAIEEGVSRYNHQRKPDPLAGPLVLVMRDHDGAIIGGVSGRTAYGWLRVDLLWVTESMRGKGYGAKLLEAAEGAAVDRGCHSAHLDTHEFQAPEFYRARGYEAFGKLADYPDGETHFYFKKRLRP